MTDSGMRVRDRSVAELDESTAEVEIKVRCFPTCYLCGAVGTVLYTNLSDQLFGAPGTWNFKRCPDPTCGLIWLDPIPIESEIGKAYKNYYTHAPQPTISEKIGWIERAKEALNRLYEFALGFTPVYAERAELEIMYLGGLTPGRVLEIGCGDGQRLAELRARGWDVQGQEVDEDAAAHARKAFGLPVFCGPLHQARFRDNEFDAVVMNHVIEHVHDPLALLKESRRVLKHGGRLVSITPNTKGWGHARFGPYWIGMDRPRHLFLFSRQTLEPIALASGFRDVKTWTTAARSASTVGGSLRLERGERVRDIWPFITRAVRQAILQVEALMARRRDPDAGDECVLSARG